MENKNQIKEEISMNVHVALCLLVHLNNPKFIKTQVQKDEVLNEVKKILMRFALYEEGQYFELVVKKTINEFDLSKLSDNFKTKVYRLFVDPLSTNDLLKCMCCGEKVFENKHQVLN